MDMIILKNENNCDFRFEFLDLIEYDGKQYVILLPADLDENEVVILHYEETDSSDESNYVSIDDEFILNEVFNRFKEKFKDEFT